MNKNYSLFIIAAAFIVMLAACGGKNPKSIDDLEGGTPADSMMYYLGQMQAATFWQDAESDTLLRSQEAREQFIKGFREALKLEDADPQSPYNKGLQLGLRLAIRLREFEKRYGVSFPESVIASSLEAAIECDSCNMNLAEAQKGFYLIKDRFELKTSQREIADAKVKLSEKSKKQGFAIVSDTLYAKDITPSTGGAKLKDGDRVAVEVTASTLDGKEIVARQFPESITIGEGRVPRIVCLGMHTMTSGQTRTFMTTPRTLFGKRYALYHLPHDEPVIFTVKATLAPAGGTTASMEEQN